MPDAFVQTKNGKHETVNFFQASKGLRELGYYVNQIEDEPEDICHLNKFGQPFATDTELTRETPVFAGIPLFNKIMKYLGVGYWGIEAYPGELVSFLHRRVYKKYLGDLRSHFSEYNPKGNGIFIRPLDGNRKQFNGHVVRCADDFGKTLHLPDETYVVCSDRVTIVSEYRVYVCQNQVLAMRHYTGDWNVFPSSNTILGMIDSYKSFAPVAYGLDVGVLNTHETVLIEVNDAINLGNYGLSSTQYAMMIAERWKEIVK